MILVRVLDLKFLHKRAAIMIRNFKSTALGRDPEKLQTFPGAIMRPSKNWREVAPRAKANSSKLKRSSLR